MVAGEMAQELGTFVYAEDPGLIPNHMVAHDYYALAVSKAQMLSLASEGTGQAAVQCTGRYMYPNTHTYKIKKKLKSLKQEKKMSPVRTLE